MGLKGAYVASHGLDRADFIALYHRAVADNVGNENRSEPPFQVRAPVRAIGRFIFAGIAEGSESKQAKNVRVGSLAVIEHNGPECLFVDPKPDIRISCFQ